MNEIIKYKAYKVFNPDWTCRNFQFEIGKTYTHEGQVKICRSGFHVCIDLADCFHYYKFSRKNKVAEVEIWGRMDCHFDDSKVAVENITIQRELTWYEVLCLVNSGYGNSGLRNSGGRNSGYSNSGHRNSGDRNSGHRNSGNQNSGEWNSGNLHTGAFNTLDCEKIYVFNKLISKKVWDESYKPKFLYFDLIKWIDASDISEQDKKNDPGHQVRGRSLITMSYKDAFKKSWDAADKEDRERVRDLPGFDADIFYEISGIDLRDRHE